MHKAGGCLGDHFTAPALTDLTIRLSTASYASVKKFNSMFSTGEIIVLFGMAGLLIGETSRYLLSRLAMPPIVHSLLLNMDYTHVSEHADSWNVVCRSKGASRTCKRGWPADWTCSSISVALSGCLHELLG